jgi:hypothetical protein
MASPLVRSSAVSSTSILTEPTWTHEPRRGLHPEPDSLDLRGNTGRLD